MLPLKSIVTDLTKYRPKAPTGYPTLGIKSITTSYSKGIKSITYKAQVVGETSNYLVYIQFFKVEFSDTAQPGFTMGNMDNKAIYYKIPNVSINPVKLKCSCPDFRFSFEKQLFDKKALIGNWRRYTRVSGSSRPPRNPNDYLGYCKHVYSVLEALKGSGLIS